MVIFSCQQKTIRAFSAPLFALPRRTGDAEILARLSARRRRNPMNGDFRGMNGDGRKKNRRPHAARGATGGGFDPSGKSRIAVVL